MSTHRGAKRSLGQHFLVDRAAARRIVDALRLSGDDALLEIGPGRGALTRQLVECTPHVAAVELDRDLAASLRAAYPAERLTVFECDVLDLDLGLVLETLKVPEGRRLVIVGNLPYNISKPIAQRLIRDRRHVDRAVLTFQREVAGRLTAKPGNRAYGPLGILAGQAYEIRTLFDLAPGAFRPRPKVDSTVTGWRRRLPDALDDAAERRLRLCLGACFRRRRRTLRNNLRSLPLDEHAADGALDEAQLDGKLRPEALTPEEFVRLAGVLEPLLDPATERP